MEEYKLKDMPPKEPQNSFAPQYDIQDDAQTIADLKESLPENRYCFKGDTSTGVPSASTVFPKITIIENDDLSGLTEKQRAVIKKIDSIKQTAIIKKISNPQVKLETEIPAPPFAEPPMIIVPPVQEPISIKHSIEEAIPEPLPVEAPISVMQPIEPPPVEAPIPAILSASLEIKEEQLEKPLQEEPPLTPPRRLKRLTADEILEQHKKDFEEKRFKPSFISVSETAEPEDEETAGATKLAELYYRSNEDGYTVL